MPNPIPMGPTGWKCQMVESQTKSVTTGIPRVVNRQGPKGFGAKLRQSITCSTTCEPILPDLPTD